MNSIKKIQFTDIKKFVSESLLIVFSVLFALFINQCQNDANENDRTETILSNIEKEIKENRQSTKRLISYHTSVLTNLKATPKDSLLEKFFRNDSFVLWDNDIVPLGISQELFENIAWQTAEKEDISSRIAFEKAQILHDVYHQQEIMNTTVSRLVAVLSERETHRREHIQETIAIMQHLFEELRSQEKSLLIRQDLALKKLKDN